MPRIVNRIEIDRDIGEVFAYVTTPAYWPTWHPSTVAVRGTTDRPLRIGDRASEEFCVWGLSQHVHWTVLDEAPPRRWSASGQRSDGGSATLSYLLDRSRHGTLITGEFAYRMPGLLLKMIDGLVIRQHLSAESSEAIHRLKMLLEAENDRPRPRLEGRAHRSATKPGSAPFSAPRNRR